MSTDLYSVKMRASRKENGSEMHISGAEKIVESDRLQSICAQLLERAMHHSKGEADFINIKVERIAAEDVIVCDALPVTTCEVDTAGEGRQKLKELLDRSGITNGEAVLAQMKNTWGMRGAMLLDADSLKRLEPDHQRGVRATLPRACSSRSSPPPARMTAVEPKSRRARTQTWTMPERPL